jgi:hypothetical protein
MRKIILILILLFLTGCFNQNGVSAKYYDDCHIEYDNYGNYQTVCPYNFYNYKKTKENKDCLQCN